MIWTTLLHHEKRKAALLLVIGTVFGLIGPYVASGLLSSLQERLAFPMIVQDIDTYRHAVAHVPCDTEAVAFQGVISQAAAWNARIAHEQKANQVWYADWFFTDRWLSVPEIALPCRGEE